MHGVSFEKHQPIPGHNPDSPVGRLFDLLHVRARQSLVQSKAYDPRTVIAQQSIARPDPDESELILENAGRSDGPEPQFLAYPLKYIMRPIRNRKIGGVLGLRATAKRSREQQHESKSGRGNPHERSELVIQKYSLACSKQGCAAVYQNDNALTLLNHTFTPVLEP